MNVCKAGVGLDAAQLLDLLNFDNLLLLGAVVAICAVCRHFDVGGSLVTRRSQMGVRGRNIAVLAGAELFVSRRQLVAVAAPKWPLAALFDFPRLLGNFC